MNFKLKRIEYSNIYISVNFPETKKVLLRY
jgi:hypothetical protein